MNLPNQLTVARIIATPIFMATLLIDFEYKYLVSLVLFVLSCLSDYVDGHLARKYNIVTSFGKFLDPLADKMLISTAFIGLMHLGIGEGISIILFITLFREFLVSSLRLVTVSSGGKVVAANFWGKAKTVCQMVGVGFALFVETLCKDFGILDKGTYVSLSIVTTILLWASAVLCTVSGIIYLVQCKDYINSSK
jgi:CDP-diacylglycerol--glycerol-3-phosphate 3-phosphatidyltransferase